MERLVIALMALTVIVSGCLDAVEDEEPETPDEQDEPEVPDEDEQETTEDLNGEETTEDETEEVREITIESEGTGYDTENVEVEQGETVEFTFVNNGGSHDLRLENAEGEDTAGTNVISEEETETFTYTFEESEDYEFFCSVGSHRAQGMEGTITVQ